MKNALIILISLLPFTSFAQMSVDSIIARSNVLMEKLKKDTLAPNEKKELIRYTLSIQNKAFKLEESERNYPEALKLADAAMPAWLAMKDTMFEANLRKYRGFVLAHLNRFPEGKLEIRKAMDLYRAKGKDFGIAVSQFDFSKLYELEGKMDSAFYYANQALMYWSAVPDTFRILTIHNQLSNLYQKTNNLDKAEEIRQKSEPLIGAEKLYWQPIVDFYYLSSKLYEKKGGIELAEKYKKLYVNKMTELQKSNFSGKSLYEE